MVQDSIVHPGSTERQRRKTLRESLSLSLSRHRGIFKSMAQILVQMLHAKVIIKFNRPLVNQVVACQQVHRNLPTLLLQENFISTARSFHLQSLSSAN